jgi:hypothetical protein
MYIYVCMCLIIEICSTVHSSYNPHFLFPLFFLLSLATKVHTLVDFNDVPSEEKLPLVCEICVFIGSF